MVIEIDWNSFKTKFKDQEQTAFERLCYLLFCREHGKETGIFRFRNHAGIETNPVEKDGKVIGWQAKFYDTRLSEHKDDFIDSIDTTKTKYPDINQIVFYTNQAFGQGRKENDPQYKIEIEDHARVKGIDIEWRTASYFEAPFVCEQNFSIAEHFFSLKKGILDSVVELKNYTEAVLQPIRSEISFGGSTIKLDRSAIVGAIRDTAQNFPLVVLSGGPGVGKTAVVKDLYEVVKESTPFFVFKATQFKNASHPNQLFKDYGEITAAQFFDEHKDINVKFIVFDSAERLSEIEDQDVFRMFLSDLVTKGWRIIFTVRHSYLDDLRFQLKEFYGASFATLDIPYLSIDEIAVLAKDHNFVVPTNERLANLLLTPLYLNEYLQIYDETKSNIGYTDFREIIWKKQIQNSSYQSNNLHRRREECFLEIAKQRAAEGGFVVKTKGSDHEALQKLEASGIVKFDPNAGGYFITHDAYEEWALDIFIERSFASASDFQAFYREIGDSLPIRRAFRGWLSDKLSVNDERARGLISFTVQNSVVENYWKDEVVVSVLLSDYSNTFFKLFEEELLKEPERIVSVGGKSEIVRVVSSDYKCEQSLLHRVFFLLRIACKTVDEDFLKRLGVTRANVLPLETIFTTPKGSGWASAIAFIDKCKETLQLRYMNVILPVLDDWNRGHRQGETTKNASRIALFYYTTLTAQEGFYFSSRDSSKDQLVRVILNGSGEIKGELKEIIDEVIAEQDTTHRGRYYELVKVILSSIVDSLEIAKHLPREVMKLANLFWFYTPPKDNHPFSDYRNDIEQYFDLASSHHQYYPSSAFQTPVLALLQTAPQEAVDFMLSFTNRSIEYFSKSELGNEAEEIDVVIDDADATVKQYIGHRIWNAYRGTQVVPPLLESMHMALESWLLTMARTWDPEIVEKWCIYLIKNSRSASITAVVVSVVLAEPNKLFNVAKMLFRTKDFFFFDSARMQLDMTHAKFSYSMAHDPLGIFKDERLKTCDDKHRSHSLEDQALSYQMFAIEGEDEKMAKSRQEVIWKIFDRYYAELPDKSEETNSDRTWRLCLARMDRRKMKIVTEKKGDQVLISFNPEIDPQLRQYSEDAQARSSEAMKYLPLQLWARNRFEGKDDARKYPQYENDYSLALAETRAVFEQLRGDKSEDGHFELFYRAVPSYVCAVLIRDYSEKLMREEAEFCRAVVLEYSSMPLRDGYRYQIGDGLDAAIVALPLLLKRFPGETARIKITLLNLLFDSYPIGSSQRVSDYAVSAVLQHLWTERGNDANAILYGYLLLKPRFEEISDSIREENRKKRKYDFSRITVLERFEKEYADEIHKVTSNQVTYSDIPDITKIDPDILVTAFLLVPLRTDDEDHKKFLRDIGPLLTQTFKDEDRRELIDYTSGYKFLTKFARFVLSSKKEEIRSYVQPFVDLVGDFRGSKYAADLLVEFVIAEDALGQYDEFWTVWQVFYPKIVELCADEHRLRYSEGVVYKYLLALEWRKGAKEWHSLKDREKAFFKKVSEDMGSTSAVLYAISKLLNGIGSSFASEGISWISNMLEKTPDLARKELEVNTVYYLENLVRSYILRNHHEIKTSIQLRKRILIILDFLLAKGSVAAYLLREDVL